MKHEEQKTVVEIGQLIKSERKRQGVTQMQLAGIAGTGIRFISDLENGKGTIQVQKLLKVLQTLGLGSSSTRRGTTNDGTTLADLP